MSAVTPARPKPTSVGASPPTPLREFATAFAANRGALLALFVFAAVVLGAVFAPWLAPHDPIQQVRDHMLVPPMWQAGGLAMFPLGSDELGRCVLSGLLFGARVSLLIGLASVLLALLPGVLLGLLAALYGKWLSPLIMRLMDILLALPGLLLAICVIAILGPGLVNTVIAIAVGTLRQQYSGKYAGYVPPGVANGTYTASATLWDPIVKAYTLHHANVSYTGIKNLTLTVGVKNLLDKDPPYANSYDTNTGSGSSWEPRVADPRGRSFVLGLD